MRIVSAIAAMQRSARQWRRRGVKVAFVPTMGYLHDGHLSLVKHARQLAGPRGIVVVSIYVNPAQFGPKEDLSRYPRDVKRDLKLCRTAGVDVVFTPTDAGMYPGKTEGSYSTYVVEEKLSRSMEGIARPEHFRGVTTVVAKLFNIVQPDVAVFGAKDFQQAAVVKRMVRDLNFPVRIVVAPTLREPDGLAMSSRNKYLTAGLRVQATVLWHSIQTVRRTVSAVKKPIPATKLRTIVQRVINTAPAARLDYVEYFDSETLSPVAKVSRGAQMALAVFVGQTRLIDNATL